MAQSGSSSIIHKKARSGREEFDARAMSPSKALRLALAKSADTLFDLALSVLTVEQREMTASAVARTLGDDGLLILLDGQGGRRGAVKLDTLMIAALIEAQIIGEVRPTTPRARAYTRTDAAMAAPFLEAVLKGYDDELSAEMAEHVPLNMRFGDQMEDARVLALALEGAEYDLFALTVDLADGAKTGVITVLLPQVTTAQSDKASKSASKSSRFAAFEKNALDATATLDAVLARLTLPLKEICALKPGMHLTIPIESISETELYAPKKHLVAEVRLGQLNGQRAVRLTSGQDQELARAPEETERRASPTHHGQDVIPPEPVPTAGRDADLEPGQTDLIQVNP